MAKTIRYGDNRPSEHEISWFSKNVGPRTAWLSNYVGGQGWYFERRLTQQGWYLTVEDEKMLMYWILVR